MRKYEEPLMEIIELEHKDIICGVSGYNLQGDDNSKYEEPGAMFSMEGRVVDVEDLHKGNVEVVDNTEDTGSQTPETTPDPIPETTPETTPDPIPETTPETTPDVTPDPIPETTPDITPDPTPQILPPNPYGEPGAM